jgi:polysaccharide deacetylase 2 family uncharacterized protein YibQ
MAGKKNQTQQRAREKSFILVTSALILLTLAGLVALDGQNRARLFASGVSKPPKQPIQEISVSAAPLADEAFSYFAKQEGIQTQALNSIHSPPVLSLATALPEIGFSRILEGFLKDSSCRLQKWEGETPRYSITLGRGQEGVTLDLRFADASKPVQNEPTGHKKLFQASDTLPDLPAAQFPPAKIALILDDAGSGAQSQWVFLDLPVRLSFAVLPGHPNSRRFAEMARARGHDVLVHLPMQPNNSERQALEKEMLKPGMDEREVARVLDAALLTVPGARGINNHQGSLATQDRDLMRRLMRCLTLRGLFFVDSFTHAASVGLEEAIRAGMPGRRRDFFLDDTVEAAAIEEALHSLVRKAIRNGKAIGIGHVTKPETLRVLQEKLPLYRARGIEFVGVSEFP